MIHNQQFLDVLERRDLAELRKFLVQLVDEPNWVGNELAEVSLDESRVRMAAAAIAQGIPEFQGMVDKAPAIQMMWLATQLAYLQQTQNQPLGIGEINGDPNQA